MMQKHYFSKMLILWVLWMISPCGWAQDGTPQKPDHYVFGKFSRYAKANAELGLPKKGEKRVVFLGNSITDNWARLDADFFQPNGYIGRGISGQTSFQFLTRFREDVIQLKPKVVVINYGTNDIAENTGAYNEDYTFGNVCSMCELAQANGIKVILTSCLPAGKMFWRPSVTNVMDKIRQLNNRVQQYARTHRIVYVDYFSALQSEDGTEMDPRFTKDGVHPNLEGYKVMEALIHKAIQKIL